MSIETILIIITLVSGFYMAWNIGANDVANAMGTSVGSGALTLRRAVIVAALLEFSGAFFFGAHVSETLQSGIVNADIFAHTPLLLVYGMISALIATGLWLQIASYFGWPVSTTHAIVGGVIGFGAIVGGVDAIYWGNVAFIVTSWVLSPLCGAVASYLIFTLLRKHILYTHDPVDHAKKLTPLFAFVVVTMLSLIMIFRGLQNLQSHLGFFSALFLSLLIGAAAALISYLLVRGIKQNVHSAKVHPYNADLLNELDKTRKSLEQIQNASRGEMQYRVSHVLNELNSLLGSVKSEEEPRGVGTEYRTVERIFGYLQIMSACLMAFAHGSNDVANAIGPLSAALNILQTGVVSSSVSVPSWALALGGAGIVIGLATWGWRVIETIGRKITELTPTRGFSAEFGAASTILIASELGMPISTTHTLVGSVIGVGMARGIEALNLGMTRDIVVSWVVTIPASALFTVLFFYLFERIF